MMHVKIHNRYTIQPNIEIEYMPSLQEIPNTCNMVTVITVVNVWEQWELLT